MGCPNFAGIVLGYEYYTVSRSSAIDNLQVLVKIFAPEVGLFVQIVEYSSPEFEKPIRKIFGQSPILASERQGNVELIFLPGHVRIMLSR